MMNVSLIMTWNLKPDIEQEYFEFVVRDWVPSTTRLGLQTVAAWYTSYRADLDVPMIRVEGVVDTLEEMRRILQHPDWLALQDRLAEYVEDYSQKVLYTTGEFLL